MKFDELCSFLKDNGFRRVSVEGAKKASYINKDYSVSVTVEENQTQLTEEQVKMIKMRLRDLGYLDNED